MGELLRQHIDDLCNADSRYRSSLNVIIKYEIQCLLERLSRTGEEAVVITTSVDPSCPGYLGSCKGEQFIQDNDTLSLLHSQLIDFCKGPPASIDSDEGAHSLPGEPGPDSDEGAHSPPDVTSATTEQGPSWPGSDHVTMSPSNKHVEVSLELHDTQLSSNTSRLSSSPHVTSLSSKKTLEELLFSNTSVLSSNKNFTQLPGNKDPVDLERIINGLPNGDEADENNIIDRNNSTASFKHFVNSHTNVDNSQQSPQPNNYSWVVESLGKRPYSSVSKPSVTAHSKLLYNFLPLKSNVSHSPDFAGMPDYSHHALKKCDLFMRDGGKRLGLYAGNEALSKDRDEMCGVKSCTVTSEQALDFSISKNKPVMKEEVTEGPCCMSGCEDKERSLGSEETDFLHCNTDLLQDPDALQNFAIEKEYLRKLHEGSAQSMERTKRIVKDYLFSERLHWKKLKCEVKSEPVEDYQEIMQSSQWNRHRLLRQGSVPEYPLKRKYTCNVCGEIFRNRQSRDSHVKLHESPNKFNCLVCGAGFEEENVFQEHEKRHSESHLVCENCGYRCLYKFRMDSHRKSVRSRRRSLLAHFVKSHLVLNDI